MVPAQCLLPNQEKRQLLYDRNSSGILPGDILCLHEAAKAYSERTSRIALTRYDKALDAMQAAGASVSRLPDTDRRQWIDSLEPLAKQWVERYEQKNLPAKRVLSGLMNGLRARGVQPMQDWDEHLD